MSRTFLLAEASQVERLAAFLKRQLTEHPLSVAVDKWRERRSTSQNARLWLLHTKASEVTGYAPEEMHELALCRHFGSEEFAVGGVRHRRPLKRSSTQDTKEFAAFMEATEAWYVAELGVWLE